MPDMDGLRYCFRRHLNLGHVLSAPMSWGFLRHPAQAPAGRPGTALGARPSAASAVFYPNHGAKTRSPAP